MNLHVISVWIIRVLLCFIISLMFSCENPLFYNKCPDCTQVEPITATINAKLTPFSTNGFPTVISIYEGKLEDGILLGTFETTNDEWKFTVTINKIYTVTATYYMYGSYYISVDSTIPRVKYEKVLCEQPCFYIVDNKLDLRLKHY